MQFFYLLPFFSLTFFNILNSLLFSLRFTSTGFFFHFFFFKTSFDFFNANSVFCCCEFFLRQSLRECDFGIFITVVDRLFLFYCPICNCKHSHIYLCFKRQQKKLQCLSLVFRLIQTLETRILNGWCVIPHNQTVTSP